MIDYILIQTSIRAAPSWKDPGVTYLVLHPYHTHMHKHKYGTSVPGTTAIHQYFTRVTHSHDILH